MQINLVENFRALFYVPFYATFALKAYEAEGVDVRMKSQEEFGNSLKALAAGGGEVSWGGPMRLMVARDKDPKSASIAFCEVVGRDPFYLVGRRPNPDFRFDDLKNLTTGTVSEVPTPWICLQYDLKLAGIDPGEIRRVADRTMADNVLALRKGEVEVIQVYQPIARSLVEEGIGHVWYSAASRGPTCYTTLNTTRTFFDAHPDVILAMIRATYRTQKWIAENDAKTIAELVTPYLPDVSVATLIACCDEYRKNDVWSKNPIVQRGGLEWKRDAMLSSGAIRDRLEFEDYADMRYAEQVLNENPASM